MMPSSNVDALASLRATAESRQMYNQAFLSRLGAGKPQSSLLSRDLLGGISQSPYFPGGTPAVPTSANDAMLLAAAARNSQPGGGAPINRALLAAAAARGPDPSSGVVSNAALTQQYLQLLQSRQGMSGLTGGPNAPGPPNDGDDTRNEERYG